MCWFGKETWVEVKENVRSVFKVEIENAREGEVVAHPFQPC